MINSIVHIDVDDPQWGRVVSDGRIVEAHPNWCLIEAFTIRANIIVATKEIHCD